MFKEYKITSILMGDIVNGRLSILVWTHVNVEKEKQVETSKINNETIDFNSFSDKRFEEMVDMFSDRVYVPIKLSNRYIHDINYSRKQFQKDVDKVNTRWIREYIKYEIAHQNPLYVNKSNDCLKKQVN